MSARSVSARLGGLAALTLVCSVAGQARAYCLTHTCDPKTEQCDLVDGCNVSGKVLFWASSTVSFDVQKDDSYKVSDKGTGFDLAADGSKQLLMTSETLDSVVTNAFVTWVNADCGGGQTPKIRLKDLGFVDCAKPEYNKDQPNQNVITFHDSPWPYTNTGAETLALTTVFFNGDTGEIYDANIEINTNEDTFSVGTPSANQFDLNAVLTHEVGHFLGLSHSSLESSTMYSSYSPGMVTLEKDDDEAICAAMPPDRTTTTDSYVPRHGWSSECSSPETGCCATAIGGNSRRSSLLGLWAFGLGLVVWRGRARSKRATRA